MQDQIRQAIEKMLHKATDGPVKVEIIDELCANLSEKYQELTADGVPAEQAFSQVLDSVGDVSEIVSFINSNSAQQEAREFDFSASFQGFEQKLRKMAKEWEGPVRGVVEDLKQAAGKAKDKAGKMAKDIKGAVVSKTDKHNFRYDYNIAAGGVSNLDLQLNSGDVRFGISEDESIYIVELSRSELSEEKRATIVQDGTTPSACGTRSTSAPRSAMSTSTRVCKRATFLSKPRAVTFCALRQIWTTVFSAA